MKKPDLNTLIYRSMVVILCIFLFGGTIWGANSVLKLEGTMVPVTNAESLSPLPQSVEEVTAYLNSAIVFAKEEKPKLYGKTDIEIPHDEEKGLVCVDSDNSLLLDIALYIRESVADSLKDGFENIEADFGEGFENKLCTPNIKSGEIDSWNIDYIYYKCPSCGENYDAEADSCEKCGSERSLDMMYRDEYTITLDLAGGTSPIDKNSALARNFHLRTDEEIKRLTAEQTEDFFDYSIDSLTYSDVKIVTRVNRLTDKITYLGYEKNVAVNITATFKNEFFSLGSVPVSFVVKENVKFDFTWPGLSLSQKTLSIEKKTTDNLEAILTCSDPVNTEVVWTSSDESIATVDEDGYVTAGSTDGSVIVTATMKFQGKTYSDSCKVMVKTSVEKIDISKRDLKLAVGDTFTLTAEVSPKKATIQSVKWYSTDEKIATVDKEGKITAVSDGEVKIFALSDDGFYKATCEVEVTK